MVISTCKLSTLRINETCSGFEPRRLSSPVWIPDLPLAGSLDACLRPRWDPGKNPRRPKACSPARVRVTNTQRWSCRPQVRAERAGSPVSDQSQHLHVTRWCPVTVSLGLHTRPGGPPSWASPGMTHPHGAPQIFLTRAEYHGGEAVGCQEMTARLGSNKN